MLDEAESGIDTAAEDTAVIADSPSQADSTGGASAATDTTKVDAPAEAEGSLADSAEVQPNQKSTAKAEERPDGQPAQAAQPADDWKKRYDGQYQASQRISREKKELEGRLASFQSEMESLKKQYTGVNPQEVQQWRQQQEAQSLPVWNPKHPEHQSFQSAHQKFQFFNDLVNAQSDPAVREAITKQFQASVSPQDRQRINMFIEHGERERVRMQMDPQGYIQSQVQSLVEREISKFRDNTVQSYQESVNARTELAGLQQKYPELATAEHLTKIMELVQQGAPMSAAFHAVRADILEKRISGANVAKASAEEKERLLTQSASISRDPAISSKVDLWAEAEKIRKAKHIPSGDKRMMTIYDDLRRKHNIKE